MYYLVCFLLNLVVFNSYCTFKCAIQNEKNKNDARKDSKNQYKLLLLFILFSYLLFFHILMFYDM